MNNSALTFSNRSNAFLWLVTLLCFSLFIGWKTTSGSPFYSDITELLPKTSQQPEVATIEHNLDQQFSRQLLLLLRTDDETQSLALTKQLESALLASKFVAQNSLQQNLGQALENTFQPYRNQLLSGDARQQLINQSPEELAQNAASGLFNPTSTPRPYAFSKDPFNLGGQWLEHSQANTKIELHNGRPVIKAAKGNWYVINLELNASPFDLRTQADIIPIIENFEQGLKQTSGSDNTYELLKSGILFHASAGAELAQNEISTVGIGSIIAIALLVITVFRSGVPFLGVFIALSSGLICALAVSLLVFDRIHLLTLAFGSTLLGVAVDYCFHFMLNSQQLGCSQRCRQLLGPALATSALSSIAAYLLQLTTPFPGIQQMAVFSAAGLAGTWLAVIALGPFYRPQSSTAITRSSQFFQRHVLPMYQRYRAHHRVYMGVTCGLFLLAGFILHTEPGNNDIRTLNTSGDSLINETKAVEQLLQPSSSSRFFIVSAVTEEELLERLEQLHSALQPLKKRQFIRNEQSIAHWVPSQKQQQKDYTLINEKLYQQALPELCQLLGMDNSQCQTLKQSARLQFNNSLTLSSTDSLAALSSLKPIAIGQSSHAAVLLAVSPLTTDDDLIAISDNIVGARFVNRVDNLSELLVSYRQAVASYLALALILISAVLLYRYKLCGLRILIPMTLSSLLGLSVAAQYSGLTVFHLLAVLLVVGIALDTGIFYREMGLNGESWLAATLSSLTSILAFGLLSLSQVPVLNQFGVVVLTGILSSWLLTPVFFAGREDCQISASPEQ